MILTVQSDLQVWITLIIIIITTFIIRFTPFIFFGKKQVPKVIIQLGELLPYAIMITLVVYCIKQPIIESKLPIAELISIAFISLIHYYKKNTVLSILLGTVLYMILIQIL